MISGEWQTHPSGITSRSLPDGWPPVDEHQGFTPPYSVTVWDMGSPKHILTTDCIFHAMRRCTIYCPRFYGETLEVTDSDNRTVIEGPANED